ncbi:MAG: rRNA methyltransferase [Firmicutes bacterium]|nr:rRNA methyltransferase [Bacillota bacterium]
MAWDNVLKTIEPDVTHTPFATLRHAAQQLSQNYRQETPRPTMTREMGLAYVLTRMPATYHALLAIFHRMAAKDARHPTSLFDAGAGPGTAVLAASEVFLSLRTVTALEPDAVMRHLGHRLTASLPLKVHWRDDRLRPSMVLTPHDLVVASYVLGELPPENRDAVLTALWEHATQFLVVVEPGTPEGFKRIRHCRQQLIQQGATIVAPCPHAAACPMPPHDWCHFSVRVPRSKWHRQLKGGDAPFEDEKYAYIVASRHPLDPATARIIRHPWHQPGHIQLTLCTTEGLRQITVARREGERFRQARKASWGDAWPPHS